MTIQVFTVEEGMAIKDNSGTTVFDVTNAGNMTVDGTSALQGATTFGSGGTTFTFPTADGTANQALITDGAGNVSWVDQVLNILSILLMVQPHRLFLMATQLLSLPELVLRQLFPLPIHLLLLTLV